MSRKRKVSQPAVESNGEVADQHLTKPQRATRSHVDPASIEMGESVQLTATDPFNPQDLVIPMDLSAALRVRDATLHIPVRKPSREWFFRCHTDREFGQCLGIIELKESQGEVFAVAPVLEAQVRNFAVYERRLVLACVTLDTTPFLWPLKLHKDSKRPNPWTQSALDAAGTAQRVWVRLEAQMTAGAYKAHIAEDDYGEPQWPDMSMMEMIKLAFRDRFIDSMNHPVIRQLRGKKV